MTNFKESNANNESDPFLGNKELKEKWFSLLGEHNNNPFTISFPTIQNNGEETAFTVHSTNIDGPVFWLSTKEQINAATISFHELNGDGTAVISIGDTKILHADDGQNMVDALIKALHQQVKEIEAKREFKENLQLLWKEDESFEFDISFPTVRNDGKETTFTVLMQCVGNKLAFWLVTYDHTTAAMVTFEDEEDYQSAVVSITDDMILQPSDANDMIKALVDGISHSLNEKRNLPNTQVN